MALQSEIEFQWDATDRSQLPSINYVSGDKNHGALAHKRALCSLEQEERRGGCYCLPTMHHQMG